MLLTIIGGVASVAGFATAGLIADRIGRKWTISTGLGITIAALVAMCFVAPTGNVVGKNGESIGEVCEKYFKTKDDVPTEDRNKVLRLLENLCLGTAAVGYRTESMHGAGSPQAQRIMISRQGNIQGKKQLAKDIAGIEE